MECKAVQRIHVHEAGGDLIETLWNVKAVLRIVVSNASMI